MEYEIYPVDELRHWGVKGMRWGVRRYQNRDGTLTPAGKKRYDKELEKLKAEEKMLKNQERTKAKLDKLEELRKSNEARRNNLGEGKKTEEKKTNTKDDAVKKTIKDLSDDELAAIVRRAQLEKQYRDLHPQQVSGGKKFIDQTIMPAITTAGRNLLTDFATKKGKEFLGLNDKKEDDPLKALKKEIEELNLKKQKNDLTAEPDPLKELEREFKRRSWERQMNKWDEEDKQK